ncbi:OmpP1/FadL family transporter [Nitratireductor sp. CH_MIT9313-5]|uniref:OmpP1/FadL family transporter n=1 Tax=Nitratireductor sp. CH_MIT9313-5 TaxID=3107764 RepID=UPI00300B3B34
MRFRGMGFTALSLVLMAGAAQANGFSRGTADTDILYEPGNFNMRAGATIVVPSQKFTRNPGGSTTGGNVGVNYLESYVIPSAAIKFSLTDSLACATTMTTPYGASSSYEAPYGRSGKMSEEFTISEFGATCAAFVNVGSGRLSVLGGAFVEKFNYDLLAGAGAVPVELESNAYGWRAGLGYEIPDIALRAQLLYRSGTSHEATGTATTPFGVLPATGAGELPQSVELKVQSGIAPGWLAFGSVKWTDWSVNETLVLQSLAFANPLNPTGTVANQYYWDDSWTITGGVAHAFNEQVAGLVSLQWDQGVSTGYDFRSDKWVLAAGLSLKDTLGGEVRLGGGISYLEGAEITAADSIEPLAAVDSGWAGALSASYSVKW